MTETCPLCEQPASATVEVSMGSNWSDTFGKPPHSLFAKYKMVHAADTQEGKRVVFLHTERDLQAGGRP